MNQSNLAQIPEENPPAPSQGKPAKSTLRKLAEIGSGFLGWWLINDLIWRVLGIQLSNPNIMYGDIGVICFSFPINILLLVTFAIIRQTRLIALGILIAIALNLLVSLILGLFMNAICFIPLTIH